MQYLHLVHFTTMLLLRTSETFFIIFMFSPFKCFAFFIVSMFSLSCSKLLGSVKLILTLSKSFTNLKSHELIGAPLL